MRRLAPIRLLPLAASATALAQSAESCKASGGRFCDLPQYLHDLYAIAALLGVILLVVILGTVLYFRRAGKMKIEP